MTDDAVRLTTENLRALAHPLRVEVLGLLRIHGPATASTLAEQLGLTSGALSYHLRQLERFGFIVEDPTRGNKRDRWWRAAHRMTAYAQLDPEADPERQVEAAAFEEIVTAKAVSTLNEAQAARGDLPPEWLRAFEVSDYLLQLSAAEASQLAVELSGLLDSCRQHDPDQPLPDGRRVVRAQFQIFPLPDHPTPSASK
jgi:DNA-binding transcriptional ArsR family regulator